MSNNFYNDNGTVQQNIRFDCHYGIDGEQYDDYIVIESGGDTSSSPAIHYDINPPEDLSIFGYFIPNVHPEWANFVPRYIKNRTGNLYVAPGANDSLVLSTVPYYWYFVDSGNGYYYIKNFDLTKAITITTAAVNSSVVLSTFNQNDSQKWSITSVESSEHLYFSPKNLQTTDISVDGTPSSGSTLKLKTHNTSSYNSMWLSLNTCIRRKIKNQYSNFFVASTLTNDIIQSSSASHWNITDAGNGYVYILSTDNTKAITISGTSSGDDLTYSNYVPGNENQMWYLDQYGSNIYYIVPKLAPTMNIDIENNYLSSGSRLELYTHNDYTDRMRWIIEE